MSYTNPEYNIDKSVFIPVVDSGGWGRSLSLYKLIDTIKSDEMAKSRIAEIDKEIKKLKSEKDKLSK